MLLTDEEITLIVRECARGSAINRDGSTSHRIARAIEAAVLAKLREQKPVGYVGKVMPRGEGVLIRTTAYDMQEDDELYIHPAPIPEGMKLLGRVEFGVALIDEAIKADPRLKGVLLAQLAKLAAMTSV